MIREISRAPAKVFRISDSSRTEIQVEVSAGQDTPSASDPVIHPALASKVKVDTHEYFARLGDYFIAKFGDRLATVKAQMLFDACGPGRDIDPQSLFLNDSDGDSWTDALSSLKI